MFRFKPYLFKRAFKKYRFIIFFLFLLLIVIFLWYKKINDIKKQSYSKEINSLLKKDDFNSCKKIKDLDKNSIIWNKYISNDIYKNKLKKCLNDYDIKNISFNKDICWLIVNIEDKQNLYKYFLRLDSFQDVKNKCISKYLNLKFWENKWLNKKILFDVVYPKNVRYTDKFNIDISVFNNSNLDKKIFIEYNSVELWLKKKRIELNINKNSFKNYNLNIENTKIGWKINLNIDFIWENGEKLESKILKINIEKTPSLTFDIYKYWRTNRNNLFIDSDFKITKDINKLKSKVNIIFYNNSFFKISEIFKNLENNKVYTSFYDINLFNTYSELQLLSDNELEKINLSRNIIKRQKENILNDLKKYAIDTWLYSIRKKTNIVDFLISAYIYVDLMKNNIKNPKLNNLKKNLYYYITDRSNSLQNRLNIMMILSNIDKNIDLRFINNNEIKNTHDLIVYTYALFNTWPIINDDLIKINIAKIKNQIFLWTSKKWYFSSYTDKLLFLNFLLDYHYYDKKYILKLTDEINKKDFSRYYISSLDRYLAISALIKKYKNLENNNKTKYGFMIWLIRNTSSTFWLWWRLASYKKFWYNLSDLLSLWDNDLIFRTKKIFWKDLMANVILKKSLKDKKDIINFNKNIFIKREIFKIIDWWKYILNKGPLVLWENYKIVDSITFIDKRPRKNIVVKDFLPSNVEFVKNIKQTPQSNYFYNNNNNYLEYQFAKYWGKTITLSYLIKVKNTGEYLDPWIKTYLMFDEWTYWTSILDYIVWAK